LIDLLLVHVSNVHVHSTNNFRDICLVNYKFDPAGDAHDSSKPSKFTIDLEANNGCA